MKLTFIVILLVTCCCQSCNNSTSPKELSTEKDSSATTAKEESNVINSPTHLKDTTTLSGSFILFLLPDPARFKSLEEEPGVYEVDSDFGVGISNTIDSIAKNEKYKSIKAYTTDKRYIRIMDCDECPIVIDRDTVNYGVILSSKGKKLKTDYNEIHSGDYLQSIEEYFQLH